MMRFFLAALLILSVCTPASARDLFTSEITIGGGASATVGTNKARNMPDAFSTPTLTLIDPTYDGDQTVSSTLDLRGLSAFVDFNASSSELRFRVPGAGIDVTFNSGSRDQSVADFQNWLEGEFGSATASNSAATRFMQALVAHSPVDPVAGNPGSLQSRMFDADYRMAMAGSTGAFGEGGILPSIASLKLSGGFASAGDFEQTSIEIPMHIRFGFGDLVALAVDLPLAATSTQGAWTLLGSGALAVHLSPISGWTLTPAVRVGGVGSVDLGGLAAMYSATLTSHIRFPFGPFAFGIGNMAGFAHTIDEIEVAGYSLTYDLQNWNLRNGVYAEMALGSEFMGTGLALRVLANDARFFGDDLWLDSYQEVGAAVAGGLPFGGFQLGLFYLTGKDYDAVTARVGLRF